MIVPDRDCVFEPVELLDVVPLGLCDGVTEGVEIGEAPFDDVAVCDLVPLGVNEEVDVTVLDGELVLELVLVGVMDGVGVKVVLVEAPKDIVGVPDDDGEGDAATTPITINGAEFAEPGVLIRVHVVPEPVQSV